MIELSSGDEDALQISSESADEDPDAAHGTEESSGAHINDALNMPDGQGRVLVNINHPAEEKDIFLAPQLARAVKPHQVQLPSHPARELVKPKRLINRRIRVELVLTLNLSSRHL